MDQPVAATAPAQSETVTPTISATLAAASSGDFAAFQQATEGTRAGKPVAAVAAPVAEKPAAAAPVETPAAAEARTVSKRQQQINDYERSIAELKAENARLKSPASPERPAAPAQPEAPKPTTAAEYQRLLGLPGAPKLADFDSVEAHAIAAAIFVNETLHGERETAAQQRVKQTAEQQAFHTRVDAYSTRMRDAVTADPDLKTKIAPDLVNAVPISGYPVDPKTGTPIDPSTGQPARITFANAIAEVAFRSETPAALYVYLSSHADEAARIGALAPADALHELTRLDGWISRSSGASGAAEQSAAPVPSTVTHAPPPPPTLRTAGTTTDPASSAVARGDYAAFQRAEAAKRLERVRR